uniref:Bulb-type lectin domain-containing protein n=1 Tax=Hucho hucho TaxID=62062 RepID=A0A4W5JUY5_9TELE
MYIAKLSLLIVILLLLFNYFLGILLRQFILYLQTDGNFVLYSWGQLILQQDGNLVIYARVSQTRSWPSHRPPNNAQSGQLTLTDKGAPVLYSPRNVVWCSCEDTSNEAE